ncbi:MAG: hypothetical protein ACP5NS_00185 [Candidatus Pacearchaeota archaeon]
MKGQSYHTSGYQGRRLDDSEFVEMSEEELFRNIGYNAAMNMIRRSASRLIPFQRRDEKSPVVSQDEGRVRSRIVQFLRVALDNARTITDSNYIIPKAYAISPDLMKRHFLLYFKNKEGL